VTLKDQILAAFKKVYDPEMPVNIYELGLIYGVEVDEAGQVAIRMTPAGGSGTRRARRPRCHRREVGTHLRSALDESAHVRSRQAGDGYRRHHSHREAAAMKLSANEEYGLRCLVRIGYAGEGGNLTIPEMSQAEGVSPAYAAKILRVLRKGGFVKAARGKEGGYTLARPAEAIVIGDVMDALGGRIFESSFCDSHSGQAAICTRSVDCSVRSLWRAVQVAVDQVLSIATLRDLLQNEEEMNTWVRTIPGAKGLHFIQ
jgi:Rrf2 family protein